MMKNLKSIIVLLCIATVFSCEEDKMSSLITDDGIAPGPVVVDASSVENLAGASKITYNLPDDEDLLYVVAEYQRGANEEISSVKSSVFNSSLTVEGFSEASEYNVTLYAVDQSGNKSVGASVVINPEEPPYKSVCGTLTYAPDYGGIRLKWENPEEGDVTIEIYSENESGGLIFKDAVYSSAQDGERLVLGLEAVETNFVFIIRDRFNNKCGQIKATITPLYIELFDRVNYQAVYQTHDTPSDYGWILPRVYDGTKGDNGYHSPPNWKDPDGVLPEYIDWSYNGVPITPAMITLDIGSISQVYRFKFWPRLGNYMYRHGNPWLFDLWGSDHLNADGSFDGWTLLLEDAMVIKPSGQPDNDNTAEDIEAAEAGFNFDISPDMPKVRYIRFVQKVAQNRTNSLLHISEMEFYGDNR